MTKPKRGNKNYKGPQDVTVYDFANSTVCNNRLKKPTTSVLYVVKQELEIKDNWDDDDEEMESILNDKGNLGRSTKQQSSTPKKDDTENGKTYPFDIWFLISNFIRPEDVGRFAGICKTSLEVVHSAQFWILLYKRYYKKECLPEEFQPKCILRYFGVRTSVIKALYRMYPPFINRSKICCSGITHPDILKGLQCVGLSSKQEGKSWCYYFKFKMNNSVQHRHENELENLLELLNNIKANSEENNCILKVISKECIPVPPIIGQTLKFVSLTLSKGFCHHRLQFIFGSKVESFSIRNGASSGNLVVMDPVSTIAILNWWHPLYITNGNIPSMDQDL